MSEPNQRVRSYELVLASYEVEQHNWPLVFLIKRDGRSDIISAIGFAYLAGMTRCRHTKVPRTVRSIRLGESVFYLDRHMFENTNHKLITIPQLNTEAVGPDDLVRYSQGEQADREHIVAPTFVSLGGGFFREDGELYRYGGMSIEGIDKSVIMCEAIGTRSRYGVSFAIIATINSRGRVIIYRQQSPTRKAEELFSYGSDATAILLSPRGVVWWSKSDGILGLKWNDIFLKPRPHVVQCNAKVKKLARIGEMLCVLTKDTLYSVDVLTMKLANPVVGVYDVSESKRVR